jgi:hypothetical protein
MMETATACPSVAPADLLEGLIESWSRETSADPDSWTERNPAWGQCAVTALIVQEYLGGTLFRGEVGPISHYWNQLPSGELIDLTRVQFGDEFRIDRVEPRTREYVLSHPDTNRRYELLRGRVRRSIQRRRTSDSSPHKA